jgi:hypothetical protein
MNHLLCKDHDDLGSLRLRLCHVRSLGMFPVSNICNLAGASGPLGNTTNNDAQLSRA